jgi:DUF3037 family protein
VPAREDFQYAILRVIPRVERGEALNAGVVLFSRRHGFLAARTELDVAALAALSPGCDPDEVRAHLQTLARVAAGDPAGGPIAALEPSERFHWLTAPSSTIIQPSEVHAGICSDPEGELAKLYDELVRP